MSSHAAVTRHEEKVKVRSQIVPMSTSSSYPCGVADRQDARLRLALRSSAEASEAARPTGRTPAPGEKPL